MRLIPRQPTIRCITYWPGPMEVPFLGIEKSDPAKRKYVYCISHSRWNDSYTSSDRNLHNHTKRDVIPSGINWIQVKEGQCRLGLMINGSRQGDIWSASKNDDEWTT